MLGNAFFAAAFAPIACVCEMREERQRSGSMEKPVTARIGSQGKAAERRVQLVSPGGPVTRFVTVVSHVAELGVFFAAAAALGAGVLSLR